MSPSSKVPTKKIQRHDTCPHNMTPTNNRARVPGRTPSVTAQEVHQEPSPETPPNKKGTKSRHLAAKHDAHDRGSVPGRTPLGTAQEVHQEPSPGAQPNNTGTKTQNLSAKHDAHDRGIVPG